MKIIIFVIVFSVGLLLLYRGIRSKKDDGFVEKIDDDHWIIGGEYVSLEEDTPLLRLQQSQEDDRHYRAYESARIKWELDTLYGDYIKTKDAISKRPELKNCITQDKLNSICDEYEKYCRKAEGLGGTFTLTREEYLIKKENPLLCCCPESLLFFPAWGNTGVYNIYNTKTARYINGNMSKKMAEEFEEKWYSPACATKTPNAQ